MAFLIGLFIAYLLMGIVNYLDDRAYAKRVQKWQEEHGQENE